MARSRKQLACAIGEKQLQLHTLAHEEMDRKPEKKPVKKTTAKKK